MLATDFLFMFEPFQLRHGPKTGVTTERHSKPMVIIEPNGLDRAGDPIGKYRSDSDEFVRLVEKVENRCGQLMRMIHRALAILRSSAGG
jgi:hypothetical protein